MTTKAIVGNTLMVFFLISCQVYHIGMKTESFEQAKQNALEKVFLDIAESGKPTQAQLDFIKMMKPKENPMKEAEDMGKFVMSMMGFMEGK